MIPLPDGIDKLYDITKGQLFLKKAAGFFGPLLCQLEFRWTRDIQTAAISHDTLYWNPEFFMSRDAQTRVTILAHEIKHNADLDGLRQGNRDHDLYNQAADHAINLFLQEHGYYMGGFPFLMDPKYKGWAREDIYDDLLKKQEKGGSIPKNQLGNDIMPISAKDKTIAIANVVAAVQSARMSNAAGSIPGDTLLVLDKYLHPKLPWNVLLHNFFNAMVESERSYTRPSRREVGDFVMPGSLGRCGLEHLCYALDISGSVTDEQVELCNNEVHFIQEDLEPEKLTLFTFDEVIHDVFEFERGDPYEKITVEGRGGTSLYPVYKFAKDRNATALVILTDLHVEIPPDPGIPIIFVCVDNPRGTVPYGVVVHMDTTS